MLWMTGRHEKSIQYYERSMQLSPRDRRAFEAYMGISYPFFFSVSTNGPSIGPNGPSRKSRAIFQLYC